MKLTHTSNFIHCYQALAIKVQMATGGTAILPRAALAYGPATQTYGQSRRLHIYWFRQLISINLYRFNNHVEFVEHYRRNYGNPAKQ